MTNLFTPLRLALLAVLLGAVAAGFVLIPPGATLPVHWGVDGTPDGFAPREVALLMPVVITAVVWCLFAAIGRYAVPQAIQGGHYLSAAVLTGLTALFAVIAVFMVLSGVGVVVSMVQAIGLAIAGLLLLMGNALPKSQPNSVAGIRIPSTLADPANWQATHRLAGRLCIVGGILLVFGALVLTGPALFVWLLACVLAPMAVAVVFSLAEARRPRG